MSSRRGGVTKGPPRHQNRTAWKPNRAVKKSENELGGKANPYPKIVGVCHRCKDQIEWRRKYGKYKPLIEPSKCVRCSKRAVRQAYLTLCPACATESNVCAKCCKPAETIVGSNLKAEAEERAQLEAGIKNLRERERRTLLRAMAKGEDKQQMAAKVDKLLAAKTDEEDDDEFDFSDEEEEEEDDDEDDEDIGEDSERGANSTAAKASGSQKLPSSREKSRVGPPSSEKEKSECLESDCEEGGPDEDEDFDVEGEDEDEDGQGSGLEEIGSIEKQAKGARPKT